MPVPLSRSAAAALPDGVAPLLTGAAPEPGIVHLGAGAFHRAHQAVFTERGMAATGDRSWGIVGVAPRSRGVVEALAKQDGLFTVLERDGKRATARVVNAFADVVHAPSAADAVVARIAAATTRAVTLTITEKGYLIDPVSGGLRDDDDAVRADAAPATAIGLLAAGLLRRAEHGGPPVTLLSCDNLTANGRALARVMHRIADRLPTTRSADLAAFLRESVAFPSSMVDRIVPATTDHDLTTVTDLTGMRDHAAVVAEPFSQWVIEDDFAGDRPPWSEAGAELVAGVAAYETAKLRILNAAHSMTAYLGALAGYETIAVALADPAIDHAVRAMQQEAIGTVEPPDGWDLRDYGESVLVRFGNDALGHRCDQVASDGSQKLPVRVVPTLVAVRARGDLPVWSMLVLAAWARFVVHGRDDAGHDLHVVDPLCGEVRAASAGATDDDVAGIAVRLAGMLPDVALDDAEVAAALARIYRDLSHGVRDVCRALAREHG